METNENTPDITEKQENGPDSLEGQENGPNRLEKQENGHDSPEEPGTTDYMKIFFKSLVVFFLLALTVLMLLGVFYLYICRDLPKISTLKDYRPPIITSVYSDDNRKIGEFYRERRIVVPLDRIPETLLDAFIAAEDARFYKHKGVDYISIIRAMFKNIEAGTIVQGGSTITQQVTKSFFLTPERSYTRKLKEAILAYDIDNSFTKEEILFLYLNQIYLGHGAYGVEAAAENYFGKTVEVLNLAECAMLAGLPQAPSSYSPFRYPEKAKNRQIYVLTRMVTEGYITEDQKAEAINTELDIKPRRNWYSEKVPCYTEHVRRYVEKKYGKELLYAGGLKIYTAVNIDMQKTARAEITRGLKKLDKRQGYRGPEKHLEPEEIEAFSKELQEKLKEEPLEEGKTVNGVVVEVNDKEKYVTVRTGNIHGRIGIDDMAWARSPNPEIAYGDYLHIKRPGSVLSVGDVVLVTVKKKPEEEKKDKKDKKHKEPEKKDIWEFALEQEPKVQSALLCIEAETGMVKVMVGGRDFNQSEFNRAVQSRRQPGSAFKPIIYAAALDRGATIGTDGKGYTPATEIIDSPIVEHNLEGVTWKPKNYGNKFYGPTLLREALAKSRNVVTIKILQDIGVDYAIEYARNLGIESRLDRNLSIALGSSGLSLLELVKAYSVFANQGYLVKPAFIHTIIDRDGNILEEVSPERKKVIEESTAYLMTNLLESVVKEGTGFKVRKLNRPVAGKTGTTNDLYDAWFVGYTLRYITGVWVGFDEVQTSLGRKETGSRAASPIWLGFMQEILKDKPIIDFPVPEGVVFTKIDAKTGLLPIPESEKTRFECFVEGTEPTEYTKKPDDIFGKEHFFKNGMM